MALTAAQIKARRETIGASDIPVILGISKHKTPAELYAEKHDTSEPVIEEDREDSKWGHKLEQIIAQAYGEATGAKVDPWIIGTQSHQSGITWATATPDAGVVNDPRLAEDDSASGYGLEIKNRAYGSGWGPSGTEEIPPDVEAQVRWSMFVFDCDYWGVGVLLGGNSFRHYLIQRDKEWEEWVFPIVEAFRAGTLVTESTWKSPVTTGIVREAKDVFEDSLLFDYAYWKRENERSEKELAVARVALETSIGTDKGLASKHYGIKAISTVVKGRESVDWEGVVRRLAAANPSIDIDGIVEQCKTTSKPYRRLTVRATKGTPTKEEDANGTPEL